MNKETGMSHAAHHKWAQQMERRGFDAQYYGLGREQITPITEPVKVSMREDRLPMPSSGSISFQNS